MDIFNSGKIKEMVYDVLQNPTRENFIDILDNGFGEQDNLDFKVQWIEAQKLAEIVLGIANSGGGAIILGVKENEDGTLESIGLSKIEDKEKIHSKMAKFLPETIKFEIADFDFSNESYSKLTGRLFQLILIYVRRHIVGGANRTLISAITSLRSCGIGTCRRLSSG